MLPWIHSSRTSRNTQHNAKNTNLEKKQNNRNNAIEKLKILYKTLKYL